MGVDERGRRMNNDRFKFRAWRTESREMYDDVYFDGLEVGIWDDDNDGEFTLIGDMRENSLLQYCVLMQSTGLKDKNGKLIYEGDIVRLAGYGNYICEFPFIELYEKSFEGDVEQIIGNIYEHPDLIPQKTDDKP